MRNVLKEIEQGGSDTFEEMQSAIAEDVAALEREIEQTAYELREALQTSTVRRG